MQLRKFPHCIQSAATTDAQMREVTRGDDSSSLVQVDEKPHDDIEPNADDFRPAIETHRFPAPKHLINLRPGRERRTDLLPVPSRCRLQRFTPPCQPRMQGYPDEDEIPVLENTREALPPASATDAKADAWQFCREQKRDGELAAEVWSPRRHRCSDCHICLADFDHGESVFVLSCQHVFHEDCARRWLDHASATSCARCPVCRVRVLWPPRPVAKAPLRFKRHGI
eukprot:TRINITY_DN71601_c0_g1_i1.p1 TRINITY_DN71601_c0_g1~~TRINITY_DN71601_c0_g1_i1.p1  ORF type:complete len:226 (-),score=28.25 TRINITY_DN71601_c0_g1_i1:150-827(-)